MRVHGTCRAHPAAGRALAACGALSRCEAHHESCYINGASLLYSRSRSARAQGEGR